MATKVLPGANSTYEEKEMQKILILVCTLITMQGCTLLDTSAGRAKYTIRPVIVETGDGKQVAACCEINIYNSKDIDQINVSGEYDPTTGKLKFSLAQEGADASGPIEAAVKNQEIIIQKLGDISTTVGKIALLP
jgi:hypothetical protein